MKGEGYGDGYRYDHDEPDAFSGQDYFPEKMGRKIFYDPPERGFERDIRKRLDWWAKLGKSAASRADGSHACRALAGIGPRMALESPCRRLHGIKSSSDTRTSARTASLL